MIDGQKRASLLIDPPDGRVPPLTEAARQRRTAGDYGRPTSDQAAREDDRGFEGSEAYNDPEIRPLAERCLVGFSSTSGPPILPTYFYNNLHQIVQTRDHVMILTEMVHDARVVRIERTASAADGQEVARRLDRPLGRRHARRRDDELQRQDAVPRIVAEPEGHRALHAPRRPNPSLSVHHRGSRDVDAAVDG